MFKILLELEIDDFLHGYFKRELEQLRKKYTINDEYTNDKIRRIGVMVVEICNGPYDLSLDIVLELINEPSDFIEIYLWLNENLNITSIENLKEVYCQLKRDSYAVVSRDYLICYQGADLDDYYEAKLEELLEDRSFVSEYFDNETLAEMWIDETSVGDVVKRLLNDEDEVQEILNLDLHDAIELSDRRKLLYSLIE